MSSLLTDLPDIVRKSKRLIVDANKENITLVDPEYSGAFHPFTRPYDYKISLYHANNCYNIYIITKNTPFSSIAVIDLWEYKEDVIKRTDVCFIPRIQQSKYIQRIKESLLLIEDTFNQTLPIDIWDYLE